MTSIDDNDPRCRTVDRITTGVCVFLLIAIVVVLIGLFVSAGMQR
jgi:hypothetical protein